MSFKAWHLAMYGVYPGTGIKVNGFEARKEGWNAAIEEAAKHINRLGQTHTLYSADFMEREIRDLKEE